MLVVKRRENLYSKIGMINSTKEITAGIIAPERMPNTPETQEPKMASASAENRTDKIKFTIIFSFLFLF